MMEIPMKARSLSFFGLMAMALLTGGNAARANPPCRDYTRTVVLPGGVARLAAGTACLADDGVWRVAEERLVPGAAERLASAYVYDPYPYDDAPRYYAPYFPVTYFSFGFYGHHGGYHHHWH